MYKHITVLYRLYVWQVEVDEYSVSERIDAYIIVYSVEDRDSFQTRC